MLSAVEPHTQALATIATGGPDFDELASSVVEAGLVREGVTVEQVAATLRGAFRAAHRSAETHDDDTAALSFPPCSAAPTGGYAVTLTMVNFLRKMCQEMQDRENKLRPSPELLQLVATAGYEAALGASMQAGYQQAMREFQRTGDVPQTGMWHSTRILG